MNQDSNAIRQEIIDFKKVIDMEVKKNEYEKDYFPMLTELQKKVYRLLKSYGIKQLAFIVGRDEKIIYDVYQCKDKGDVIEDDLYFPEDYYSPASRECCQSSCLRYNFSYGENPDPEDFINFTDNELYIFENEGAMGIVRAIDRYNEIGIPVAEWPYPESLAKYSDKI